MSPAPNITSGRPSTVPVYAIVDFESENSSASRGSLPDAAMTSSRSCFRIRLAIVPICSALAGTTRISGLRFLIGQSSHQA